MEKQTVDSILFNISQALKGTGRTIEDIHIIAATKKQTAETLNEFKKYGFIYGENRVQELLEKYPAVNDVNWHFIGQLQTNKVKYIIDKVNLIHSVDRLPLIEEIDKQAKKIGKVQDILIEVNTDPQSAKGGVSFDGIEELAETALTFQNVRVKGLMTVMPIERPCGINLYEKMQRCFESMKAKMPEIAWQYLSVGMSGDYEEALKNGSNMIRLGRAFFGERN